ncbi:hypothetical protein WJX81_000063 [Elliptochloris bilobata]|uniref:Glycosyl hydrolase family 43 n=1 Tax=Elliptochloris bilobata TaxID=381761 RepID=A0AAW1RA73_9CHLO
MLPLDNRGRTVQAHGGGMLPWGGRFYWVGEGAKPGCTPGIFGDGCWPRELELSQDINLYSSADLFAWTFEGTLINQAGIRDMPCGGANARTHPCRMERPKILYNEGTRKFVLVFHLDSAAFTPVPGAAYSGHVGILTADEVTGPYTWVRALQPDGFGSYDMSVFQAKDGTAYLVRSIGAATSDHIGVSRMAPDYLDTSHTGVCSFGPRGEGVALFQAPDGSSDFYLLNSNQTWWDPNPPQLSRAPALCGAPWRLLEQPTTGGTADITYNSQPTFVLPYHCASGRTVLIYLGDRWNFRGPGGLTNASYVWLPLVPTEGGYQILNLKSWRLRDFCERSSA